MQHLNDYDTGVWERNTPFARVPAIQVSSRNCSPAPDLVLRMPLFLIVLFSGGVFFIDAGMIALYLDVEHLCFQCYVFRLVNCLLHDLWYC